MPVILTPVSSPSLILALLYCTVIISVLFNPIGISFPLMADINHLPGSLLAISVITFRSPAPPPPPPRLSLFCFYTQYVSVRFCFLSGLSLSFRIHRLPNVTTPCRRQVHIASTWEKQHMLLICRERLDNRARHSQLQWEKTALSTTTKKNLWK